MGATCPTHPIFLDLITLTIWGEEYKLYNPSSSLLGQNILLNILFSKILSLCSSLKAVIIGYGWILIGLRKDS
jgi:hypothetical protein